MKTKGPLIPRLAHPSSSSCIVPALLAALPVPLLLPVLLLLSFLLLLSPSLALAAGNLHLGPVRILPSLQVSEIYDDNIFLAPDHEKDDWITIVSPGLRLVLPIKGRHSVQAGYRADLYAYSDYQDENRQDQVADCLLHFDFPGGLEIKAGDKYTQAAEPRTHEFIRGKRFFVDNTAFAEVGYRFVDVWKVQLNYEHIYHRYEDAPWHDWSSYYNHAGSATIFYRFLPKTSALAEFRVVDSTYPYIKYDQRDNRAYFLYGGLSWDPTAKLSGSLKGGYTWKRYEENEVAKRYDADTWSVAADLLWRITDYTQLRLTGNRIYQDYILVTNLYHRTTEGTLTLSQKILTKFTLSAKGYASRIEFARRVYNPDRDERMRRRDTLWGVGAGLLYQIQDWLSAELEYAFRKRNSNFGYYDYDENRVMLRVNLIL